MSVLVTSGGDVYAALMDGHRWLRLPEDNAPFFQTVNLDPFTGAGNNLRIEGGGIDISNINRQGNYPYFTATLPWHIEWEGFTAQNENPAWTEPLFRFRWIDSSCVERVQVRNARDAWQLGVSGQCSHVEWHNCRASDCVNGWYIENGIDLHWTRHRIERNRNAGIYWRGPDKASRGIGSIADGHFEQHGESPTPGNWGVFLENVRDVRVTGNFVYLSNIYVHSDCANVTVRDNTLRESLVIPLQPGNPSYNEGEW